MMLVTRGLTRSLFNLAFLIFLPRFEDFLIRMTVSRGLSVVDQFDLNRLTINQPRLSN